MQFTTGRPSYRRVPEAFTDDLRPGASGFVYCKGCGEALESREAVAQPRRVVTIMMCDGCREHYGHDLIPSPGAATFCYRCGGPDLIFVTAGRYPETYHVCPRCLPNRAERYREGNFGPLPQPVAEKPADTPANGK